MREPGQSTMQGDTGAERTPNCPDVVPGPVGGDRLARQRDPVATGSAPAGYPAGILAGLPAHVMDELVGDLAEAVVAMLLSQEPSPSDEGDDASGDLRQV
jgi:hypothetical protein